MGWRDGVFLGLAAAAFAATAVKAGIPLASGGFAGLLAAIQAGQLVAPVGIILTGAAALLGSLLLRLRWQVGLAAVGFAWWGLLALALWQERVIGISMDLRLPAAALAAVYVLALVLRRTRAATKGARPAAEAKPRRTGRGTRSARPQASAAAEA